MAAGLKLSTVYSRQPTKLAEPSQAETEGLSDKPGQKFQKRSKTGEQRLKNGTPRLNTLFKIFQHESKKLEKEQ